MSVKIKIIASKAEYVPVYVPTNNWQQFLVY